MFTGCTESGCDKSMRQQHVVEGLTMGTTYQIAYIYPKYIITRNTVDSLLRTFNQSLSTYIDSSLISQINRTHVADSFFEIDRYFYGVFKLSREVYEATGGAFDPSVMPLVHFWGFGSEVASAPDTSKLDSLHQLVGLHLFSAREENGTYYLKKTHPYAQLDFNAVAQGYACDVVAALLESKNINDYMIEIGGEVLCKGLNRRNQWWQIGIEKPENTPTAFRELQAVVQLKNAALATSGNYRKYREWGGKRYGHSINPLTGYPEVNMTLSVSVITSSCGRADAYATAFMVLGHEQAYKLAENMNDLEAYFVFTDADGQVNTMYTSGLKYQLLELPKNQIKQ